jgi:O-antigen ligase
MNRIVQRLRIDHAHSLLRSEAREQFGAVVLFITLTALIVLPSYSFIPWLIMYDEKRLAALLLLAAAGSILAARPAAGAALAKISATGRLLVLGILVLGLISAVLAASPRHALLEVSFFAGLVGFALVLAAQTSRHWLRSVAIALTVAAAIYALRTITVYLAILIAGDPLKLPEPFTGFTNRRFFNQYQIWTLSLTALPFVLTSIKPARLRHGLVALTVVWWTLLFASGSRGALLAVIAGLLATRWLLGPATNPVLRRLILAAAAGFGLYLVAFDLIPWLIGIESFLATARYADFGSPGRIALWSAALEQIRADPLFGIGPMHLAWVPSAYAAHPHNSVLQLAAEWGLPCTALILSGMVLAARAWTRHCRAQLTNSPQDSLPEILLTLSLSMGLAYSLFSGVIVMPLSQLLFALVAAAMLYRFRPTRKNELRRWPLQVLGLAVAIGLPVLAAPDIIERYQKDMLLPDPTIQTRGPRFWQIGGIPHK